MMTKLHSTLAIAAISASAISCSLDLSGLATGRSAAGDAGSVDIRSDVAGPRVAWRRDADEVVPADRSPDAEIPPEPNYDARAIVSPEVSRSFPEAGLDARRAAPDGSADEVGTEVGLGPEAGLESGVEGGSEVATAIEVGGATESGVEAFPEVGVEAGREAGAEAGADVKKCSPLCLVGCNIGCGPAGQCLSCPTCTCEVASGNCHC